MKTKSKWTKKWPTKPGRYWFYGWPYGRTEDISGKPVKPELNHVDIRRVSNGLMYVLSGNFWGRSEGGIGMFVEAFIPELPDVSGLIPKVKDQ